MRRRGQNPRDRVRDKQREYGAVSGKNRKNPDNAEQARADKRPDRRDHRTVDAAQSAASDLHKTAGEIQKTRKRQPFIAVGDRLRVAYEDVQKRPTEYKACAAEHKSDDRRKTRAVEKRFENALRLASAVVLRDERNDGVIKGVLCHVNEIVDIARGGTPRNGDVAERIDRGLNEYVRKRKSGGLDPGGNSDPEEAEELAFVDLQILKRKAKTPVCTHKTANGKKSGDGLRYDGRDGNARNAHAEQSDKNKVQSDIDRAR